MDPVQKNTVKAPQRLIVWIGIVALIAAMVVTAFVAVMLGSSTKRDDSLQSTNAVESVATDADIKQSKSSLETSVKQSRSDLDTASASLSDDDRIKVSE